MQLKLILKGNKIQLPIATAHTVQGFIYNALREDASYLHNLHESGNVSDSRKFKLFTFSELSGRYEIVEKQIIYDNAVSLQIRSVDSYMIQLLYTYFLNNKTVRLGNNTVSVEKLILDDKTIFSDSIKVKTMSPITVYTTTDDGHTIYFSPDEEMFYDAIIENAKRKWISYSKEISDFDFSIAPAENTRFVKRATSFKDTFITAWHGVFHLKGNVETLNFLYQTGLGSKNSQGFGLFDII